MSESSPSGQEIWELEVPEEAAGKRADAWLAEQGQHSRSLIAKWIKDGRVQTNSKPFKRPSKSLIPGQTVRVELPEPEALDAEPQDIPLSVLYEDHQLIVVNKAAGMVVHPAPGHPDGTLVNALLFHCKDLGGIGGTLRPGIVHRIDKETSGVMVCSKTDEAHACLQKQFAAHSIERRYIAFAAQTRGPGLEEAGTIESRHGRHPNDRKRFSGQHGGPRHALTHYRVEERYSDGAMRVQCTLETGRTHQIRMHLSEQGCPLLGDSLYGGQAAQRTPLIRRHALHAATLGFVHPDGQTLHFEAPLPPDMQSLQERLSKGASWRR